MSSSHDLTPGQLDDRARRRWRTFNGKQIDPTRQGKARDIPYFRRGQGRILSPHDFMPVGEHAGKQLRAVPPEYLLWVDTQPWSKHWAPWEAVHSYIERYVLPDPETAAAISVPSGPVIFITPAGILHTLPGFEDMLHAFAAGALNLRTATYQRGLPPHYALTERQHPGSLKHGARLIDRNTFETHRGQWMTHFQTRRQFVPDRESTATEGAPMSIANQNRMSAATEGCAAGYVTSDPDAMNGWEILRDAINDGALDADDVKLMGYGYACAKTNDGRQIAIATRGGWMLLPWQIVQGMTDLLPHTDQVQELSGGK